jgi:anti-sigma B factor antagonist
MMSRKRISCGRAADSVCRFGVEGEGAVKIDVRDIFDDLVEISPEGEINMSNVGEFQSACRELIDNGKVNLKINLASVPYVDSSGLGLLINLQSACKARGGSIAVENLCSEVKGLFKTARLDLVWGINLD